ncbi:response regulator [Larkinella soli]|uniref:response regulator n=1 Tax=Larkinella soli TaxID=1770527 RepID=UPI000FFBFF07|nr:response regulator transcription factor [Larkinella soli]
MKTYNIALLDDHRVVLESFANLLSTSPQFQVVGMASDKPSLLSVLEGEPPVDVLVTDLIIPSVDVIELIPFLQSRYPGLAVLVLSGSTDPDLVGKAMRAGAKGFMTKTADKAELFEAVLAIAEGRTHIDSRIFTLGPVPVQASGYPETPLTDRELEVAGLILDELSSNQIAERLFISFNTVETHRKRIYQKLGITTSLGLMKYSLSRGLLKR